MYNALISTADLMKKLDCKQQAQVEKWLKQNKIPYFPSKNGPVTTIGAIESRLLGTETVNDVEF